MSLDILLREVHEKNEGVCSIKGKNRGIYGRWYIVYKSFYYAIEHIKQIDETKGVVV
jgi:hypothetical protein